MTNDEYNKRVLDSILNGTPKPTKRKVVCAITESRIQQSCIDWFRLQYRELWEDGVFYHIPNERKCSGAQGFKLKKEGVRKGVADLCLAIPRHGYCHLYIEMKKPGSYQSPEQKEWEKGVTKHGNKYVVCKSLEDFIKLVNWYVKEE